MCISGIYSLSNEVINSTESLISTSAVDITLNEYTSYDEPFMENGKVVMPGDVVDLIPRIDNVGIDCYLRAKLSYNINGEDRNVEDYLLGDYKNWNKNGDYYYYDGILRNGEFLDIFNQVSIPDNLSNAYEGKHVIINIVVEAIQEKNFDGNWEGIAIKKSINRLYDMDEHGQSTVIYENNADRYITIDEGFFDNLGGLVPGDVLSETVKILNNGENRFNYYFTLEHDDLTDEEEKLLKNIELIVINGKSEEFIKTNLLDIEKHVLGTYGVLEGEEFIFKVHFPKELDNEFSKLLTKVTWKFSVDLFAEEEVPKNPMTGDLKFDLSITVFLLSAIGFLVVLILERRETENIEK